MGIYDTVFETTASIARTTVNAARNTADFIKNINYNPRDWYRGTKKLLRETPAEILIGAAIGCSIAGLASYSHENERAKRIPLGFSEISQIERDAENAGEEVGSMTHCLTTTNDITMKVFESWNLGNESFINPRQRFAQELEFHVDPSFRTHHYNLPMLLEKLPQRAERALAGLKDFSDVMQRIRPVNKEFDNAWDESHIDYYRTEVYTETETDSKGNTTIVTKTRQVYDHTVHSYTYRKNHGEEASRGLDTLIQGYPELRFKEKLRTASQTNVEGEYAIEKSRKGDDDKNPKLDFMEISQTWAKGSTLATNLPVIYSMWRELHNDSSLWRGAKSRAHSTSYITYSPSDSGPQEFRVAKAALRHGRNLDNSILEIINGIQFAMEQAPILDSKVREFISVSLDKKPGNAKKLGKEVMSLSKEMYSTNFKKGFDVDRFRGEIMALWMLLGSLAGGLAGFGVDKVSDKYDLWK